jgi:hypothetical protein
MTLKKKLLLIVILPVFICTFIAVLISSLKIRNQGIDNLEEKSSEILELSIQEYLAHHEDYSSIFEQDDITNVLNKESANFKFRISSPNPENKKHQATPDELLWL